jgi:hypothetical protein
MPIRLSFAACLILLSGLPTYAQAQRPKPNGPPTEDFEAVGTLEGIAPGMIRMTTNANQNWTIKLQPPQTKVELSGTAGPEFLKSGMCVKFTGEVDKQGNVKEKVAQLTVFTPSKDSSLGLSQAGAGASDDHFGAGAAPAAGGKPAAKASAGIEPGSYAIAAQINNIHGGKVIANAGNAIVKFELASDAKVDVKIADVSLARKGDKISVKGKMVVGLVGMGQASDVKIEAAESLSGAKTKPAKPPATKPERPSKKVPAGKEKQPAEKQPAEET